LSDEPRRFFTHTAPHQCRTEAQHDRKSVVLLLLQGRAQGYRRGGAVVAELICSHDGGGRRRGRLAGIVWLLVGEDKGIKRRVAPVMDERVHVVVVVGDGDGAARALCAPSDAGSGLG